MKASLVEVSPSTVMQLNDRSAASLANFWRTLCGRRASVATNPSMVAMSGRIIPEPLAMPVTTASPAESLIFLETALGTVSVVMIASAAESQSAWVESAPGIPATMRSAGRGSMITPVEKGRICFRSQESRFASAAHTSPARRTPSAPVPALALPVLTMSARTSFFRLFFAMITGAAQKRFCVNTPATVVPGARRITRTSLRFGLRTAAMAVPSSTPGTGWSESGFGGKRLTAMRLSQFPMAVLVLLPRAAGAGIVPAHLLRVAHGRLLLGGRLGIVAGGLFVARALGGAVGPGRGFARAPVVGGRGG